jgi:H+/Cl- antiporter ClcA
MATTEAPPVPMHPGRRLLPQALPAIVVGILCALLLMLLSEVAGWLHTMLWERVPEAVGADPAGPPFIGIVLTLVGVATGLVVWLVPGHAGPDPATTGLAEPPLPLLVLPGLVLATLLTLAGGVSLGPEFPIMAINTSLVVAAGARLVRGVAVPQWMVLSMCGTIGALFGTPVAAALMLSEVMAEGTGEGPPLWDRLFAPLLAAGAGSLTMLHFSNEVLSIDVPPYARFQLADVLTGSAIALVTASIGMAAVYAFPHLHRLFHGLRHPLAVATLGGLLLGLLGALGGPLSLSKGVDEIKTLTAERAGWTAAGLAGIALLKLVALLVAGTSGFRGGRIFPAVFVGAAFGLAANALLPDIPVALAVAAGILGMLLAVTRSGWLSLFTAATIVADAGRRPRNRPPGRALTASLVADRSSDAVSTASLTRSAARGAGGSGRPASAHPSSCRPATGTPAPS